MDSSIPSEYRVIIGVSSNTHTRGKGGRQNDARIVMDARELATWFAAGNRNNPHYKDSYFSESDVLRITQMASRPTASSATMEKTKRGHPQLRYNDLFHVEERVNYITQSIADVVDDILPNPATGRRTLPLLNPSFATQTTRFETSKPEDKELKGIATDIVVDDFFASKDVLYAFLKVVYDTFTEALEDYRSKRNIQNPFDIIFLYKGGSILRIIANEFFVEMPASASAVLEEYYGKYFKRSDADFSIYINPALENYDTVFAELSLLSYLLQVRLRQQFFANPTKYFSFYRYSKEYQRQILERYLPKFNTSNFAKSNPHLSFVGVCHLDTCAFPNATMQERGKQMMQNITSEAPASEAPAVDAPVFEALTDDAIQYEHPDDPKKVVVLYPLSSSKHAFFVRYNDTIEFSAGLQERGKFALMRTKVNFTFAVQDKKGGGRGGRRGGRVYTKNIAGELIDVSISHRDDTSVLYFFNNLQKNVLRYNLRFQNETFSFNSISPAYLIHDLERIIFRQFPYPWEDPKYLKRVHRLVYLSFVDLFIELNSNEERRFFLEALDSQVLDGLATVDADTTKPIHVDMSYFDDNYPSNVYFLTFVDNLLGLANRIHTPAHYQQYGHLIEAVRNDIGVLLESLGGLKGFWKRNATIGLQELEDAEMSSLF